MNSPHNYRAVQNSRVVELKIPSELGYEKIAREAVATVAKRLGFTDERIADIKLAISEACTNAISYGGNEDARTTIAIILTADDEKLDIVIRDPGFSGSPPDVINEPNIHDMVSGKARFGGMGLYIIKELMDSAEFIPGDGENGNKFHMVIYRMGEHDTSPDNNHFSSIDDQSHSTK
ncbi:MAG: ATP-binding protein [Chloroflexota bacterium]